jgi:hypothetical protein
MPWLDREFRYWQGLPMMHGRNGECIAGYTDQERVLRFFHHGRYQEVIFKDHDFTMLRNWRPGDCDPLQVDTVAVLTGIWVWAKDTLRVTVDSTAHYPMEDMLAQYMKRERDVPFAMPIAPTRVCHTGRERLFWFEGEHLSENMRKWD